MSAPLSSLFAAIDTQITANLASAGIVPTYGEKGSIDRQFEKLPPRIVWVPTDEDLQPARGQGGDTIKDAQGNMNLPSGANQPLYTRAVTVECDVWGVDRDTVDGTMINAVYSAVHDVCTHGTYGVASARWLNADEIMRKGECYRITFQFLVPVVRVTPSTTIATITAMPETPEIDPIVG